MSYTPQGWLSCNDYTRGTSAIYGERLSYANSYAGFVTQREDAPGETTHYTYDYAGRLIREKVGKQFLFFGNIFVNFVHQTATFWRGSASA